MKKQGGLLCGAGKVILILILVFSGFFYCMRIAYYEYAHTNLAKAATLQDVVINEIVWMGTEVSANDEWIELRNMTGNDVNLDGWTLVAQDGTPSINLSGSILANEYFLLERTDDNSAPAVTADLIYSGALGNSGEILELKDNENNLIDSVEASAGWLAGDNASKQTMERVADGTWQNSAEPGGTPKALNSTLPPPPGPEEGVCGDNNLDEGEECDDGNIIDNDGCSALCLIEQQEEPSPEEPEGPEESGALPGIIRVTANKLGDVVINEFVADPTDGEVEWVELYNAINEEINLENWTIEEGSEAKTKLVGYMGVEGADRFFIIEKPKGNLNNKGDIIVLRDSSGTLIDQVTYGNWDDGNIDNNAPKADDPLSVARKLDGYNSYNNINDFAITTTLTKGTSNVITKSEAEIEEEISVEERDKYDYSDDIIITEIFPNPYGKDNDDEFIELYNKGEREVNLLEWKLGDESKRKYKIANLNKFIENNNTVIRANEYLVIYRSESKIALNNGGDSVKLYQPLKDIPLQVLRYEKAIEGWSYNLEEQACPSTSSGHCQWQWSEAVTPGEVNIVKAVNHAPVVAFDCPEEVLVGVPVMFESGDTVDEDGDELLFSWDFGDQATNTLASPEHTFLKQGAYTVKLTVSDGEHETEEEKIIRVVNSLGIDSAVESLQDDSGVGQVIINEFLPNPEGADAEGEFIELYNQGSGNINLINWKVDDSEGGSKPYTFDIDLWLSHGRYYLLDRSESGLALNNTIDAVRLYNDLDELIDEIEYEKVVEGESYARGQNGKWFWTSVITPGEENIISVKGSSESLGIGAGVRRESVTKVKEIVETTLEKINEFEIGDMVKVAGTVAVEPGVLGLQYFYITSPPVRLSSPQAAPLLEQERGANEPTIDFKIAFEASGEEDKSSYKENENSSTQGAGIQVYNYNKDFPELKVGDYIEVSGEISESQGERRLKTKSAEDMKVIERREIPTPTQTTCENITEENTGQLVQVTGEVVERKSSVVFLDDGTDEVRIYLKKTTGINPKSIKEGEILQVTGLVSRTKTGLRLMPRSIDDIIKKDIESSQSLEPRVLGEVAGSDEWAIAARDRKLELFQYLLVIAGAVIVLLGGMLIKVYRSAK